MAKCTVNSEKHKRESSWFEIISRVLIIIMFVFLFIPDVNPARIFVGTEKKSEIVINSQTNETETRYVSENGLMNINLNLFTSAVSYDALISQCNYTFSMAIPQLNPDLIQDEEELSRKLQEINDSPDYDDITKLQLEKKYTSKQKPLEDENGLPLLKMKADGTPQLRGGKAQVVGFEQQYTMQDTHFRVLTLGSVIMLIGILLCCVGAGLSLGNNRMKRLAYILPIIACVVLFAGLAVLYNGRTELVSYLENKQAELQVMGSDTAIFNTALAEISELPVGFSVFGGLAVIILLLSVVNFFSIKKQQIEKRMEMPEKYRLFLMFLPVLLLSFLFAYLPLYGWRYAFYNLSSDFTLTANKFVGLKNFITFFKNSTDTLNVLRNTLIMSGLGLATSWLPIAFAILLAQIRSTKFQRTVQTLTTIPNFISWVLVFAVAQTIFSSEGFLNRMIEVFTGTNPHTVYLEQNAAFTWVKMLLWGTWKGLGWSAIIYIAGISGIDQQLYEAAHVDGANRWQSIRHVTIPGLMPTYLVMLLMSIAGILSNGMEQYLVFRNYTNTDYIQVLDLYVYYVGISQKPTNVPMATVIGLTKSVIGVLLLLLANRVSKSIRGESII